MPAIQNKHHEALSALIYGLYAIAIIFFALGYVTFLSLSIQAFFFAPDEVKGFISNVFDLRTCISNILLGLVVLFFAHILHARFDGTGATTHDSKIRAWALAGIALLATVLLLGDLKNLSYALLNWKTSTYKEWLGMGISFVVYVSVIFFVVSEFKRKYIHRIDRPGAIVFLTLSVITLALGVYLLRFADQRLEQIEKNREMIQSQIALVDKDQQQLMRMGRIGIALRDEFMRSGHIPETLDELGEIEKKYKTNQYELPLVFTDMVTNMPYHYKKVNDHTYEICGHFLLDHDTYVKFEPYHKQIHNRPHHSGKTCYTVDVKAYLRSRGFTIPENLPDLRKDK